MTAFNDLSLLSKKGEIHLDSSNIYLSGMAVSHARQGEAVPQHQVSTLAFSMDGRIFGYGRFGAAVNGPIAGLSVSEWSTLPSECWERLQGAYRDL